MSAKKIGVLSLRLYADLGKLAMGFHMIVNAVLTVTSMLTRFYSEC
jgi:hypothetical protein